MDATKKRVRLALSVLAVTVLTLAHPGTAAASTRTSMTIQATRAVYVGQTVYVKARLTKYGTTTGLVNIATVVEWLPYGSSSWARLAVVRTDSHGYVAYHRVLYRNARWRVRYPGSTAYAASVSTTPLTSALRRVTASSSAAEIYPGSSFSLSGTAKPGTSGATVQLLRNDGGVLNLVASTKLTSTGTYGFTYKPLKGGSGSYRARLVAVSGYGVSDSPSVNVLVYATHYLQNTATTGGTSSPDATGDDHINGQTYPNSIADALDLNSCWNYRPQVVHAYDLSRTAKRFRAVVGPSQGSPSGTSVRFTVSADGMDVAQVTVPFGQDRTIDVDMTGVLRVTITATLVTPPSDCTDVWADWGSARYYAMR